MGFFEDTFVKAKDMFETVGDKGSEILSVQKLKIEAAKLNSQICKNFETLGRVVYCNIQNGCEADDGTEGLVDSIDTQESALEYINKKIADEKGLVVCEGCGANNPVDSLYCSKCGSALHEKQ